MAWAGSQAWGVLGACLPAHAYKHTRARWQGWPDGVRTAVCTALLGLVTRPMPPPSAHQATCIKLGRSPVTHCTAPGGLSQHLVELKRHAPGRSRAPPHPCVKRPPCGCTRGTAGGRTAPAHPIRWWGPAVVSIMRQAVCTSAAACNLMEGVYEHTHTCTHTHTHALACTHTHTHTHNTHTHTYMRTCAHMSAHTHVHTHT